MTPDGEYDPTMVYRFFADAHPQWCVVERVTGGRVEFVRITEDGVEIATDAQRVTTFRKRWNRTLRRATPVTGMRRVGSPGYTFRTASSISEVLGEAAVTAVTSEAARARVEAALVDVEPGVQLAVLREAIEARTVH